MRATTWMDLRTVMPAQDVRRERVTDVYHDKFWGDWYAHSFYHSDVFTNDYLCYNIKFYTFNIFSFLAISNTSIKLFKKEKEKKKFEIYAKNQCSN